MGQGGYPNTDLIPIDLLKVLLSDWIIISSTVVSILFFVAFILYTIHSSLTKKLKVAYQSIIIPLLGITILLDIILLAYRYTEEYHTYLYTLSRVLYLAAIIGLISLLCIELIKNAKYSRIVLIIGFALHLIANILSWINSNSFSSKEHSIDQLIEIHSFSSTNSILYIITNGFYIAFCVIKIIESMVLQRKQLSNND